MTQCIKCAQTTDISVRMWDGKDYCRRCVEQASLLLLQYHDEHQKLSECIVVDRKEVVRDYVVMALVVLLPFSVFAGVAGGGGAAVIAIHTLLVIALGSPVVLVAIIIALILSQRVRGRIEVYEGDVRVFYRRTGSANFPLQACAWRFGRTRHAQAFFPGLYLRRRIIILHCPLEDTALFVKRIQVPCGLTDEMREIWQSFLTLAAIPRANRALMPGATVENSLHLRE